MKRLENSASAGSSTGSQRRKISVEIAQVPERLRRKNNEESPTEQPRHKTRVPDM